MYGRSASLSGEGIGRGANPFVGWVFSPDDRSFGRALGVPARNDLTPGDPAEGEDLRRFGVERLE